MLMPVQINLESRENLFLTLGGCPLCLHMCFQYVDFAKSSSSNLYKIRDSKQDRIYTKFEKNNKLKQGPRSREH